MDKLKELKALYEIAKEEKQVQVALQILGEIVSCETAMQAKETTT